MPSRNAFFPVAYESDTPIVHMSVDEYEAIRLIDYEGFSQEECSAYMKIARTTAQQVYNRGRQKLAQMLVGGYALKIEGGDYQLCDQTEPHCQCGGCKRHQYLKKEEESR